MHKSQLIGRINIYPNATEAAEAIAAMYQAVRLNVNLKMLEVAEWVDLLANRLPRTVRRPCSKASTIITTVMRCSRCTTNTTRRRPVDGQ